MKRYNESTGVRSLYLGLALFILLLFGTVYAATFDFNPAPNTSIDIYEDTNYTYDVNVTCSELLVIFSLWSDSSIAPFSINVTNGIISATPDNEDVGFLDRMVFVKNLSEPDTDKINSDIITYHVINVNDNPNITANNTESSINLMETSNYTITVTYMDVDPTNDNLTEHWYVNGVLKQESTTEGTAYTSYSGSYNFTTNFSSQGTYDVMINITDDKGGSVSMNWTITVFDYDRPPNITWWDPIVNTTIFENESQSYQVNFTDPDLGAIMNASWYVDGVLSKHQFNVTNSSFVFQTDFHANRSYFINFTVSSSSLSNTHIWLLNVTNVNRPPNITMLNYSSIVQEGTVLRLNFSGYDIDDNMDKHGVLRNGTQFTDLWGLNWTTNFSDSGVYNFTVWINDTEGLRIEQSVLITVNDNIPPAIQDFVNITSSNEGDTIVLNFTANDSNQNIAFYRLFRNQSLIASTNHVNITFNYTNRGVWNFTYFVNDTEGLSDQKTILINVLPVEIAPNITSVTYLTTINEGEYLNISFTAFDINYDLDMYWILMDGSLVSSTNSFSWLTDFTSSGLYNFTVVVNDSVNNKHNQTFNITVIDNVAPTLTNFVNISTAFEGDSIRFNFSAADVNDNLDGMNIYINGTLLSDSNVSSVYFNYTSRGDWNITYVANDTEGLSVQQSVILTVTLTNLPPNITNVTYHSSYEESELLNLSFSAEDLNENIDYYWVERDGVAVSNISRYLWQTDFSSSGIYNFTLFVNDTSGAQDSETIFITVIDNIPPNITFFQIIPKANETDTILLNFTVTDANDNLVQSRIYYDGMILALGTNYSLTLNTSHVGLKNVTYYALDDEGLSDQESFIINVSLMNRPPNITSIVYTPTIQEGGLINISFSATDINANIESYWVMLEGAVVSMSNSYLWVSNFSSAGLYNFTLYVNDSGGLNDSEYIEITIIDNTPPMIVNFSNITNTAEGSSILLNFSAIDPDSNLAHFRIYRNDTLISLTNSTNLYFNYTARGDWNITYFVNDSEGLFSTKTILIAVSPTPRAPNITTIAAPADVEEGDWLNLVFAAFDQNEDIDSFWILRNGTLVSSSNIYNLNVPYDMQGDWNYTFIVNDSTDLRAVDSRVVRVIDNIPPVILNFSNLTPSAEGNSVAFNFSIYDANANADVSWITLNGTIINYSNAGTKYFNYTSRGVWNVTYFANDTEGLVSSVSYDLLILPTELPPNITNTSFSPVLNEGEFMNLNFLAYDLNYDIDSYQILKEGVIVNYSNRFTWHTNFSDVGVWNFTLWVNDSAGNIDFEYILVNVIDNNAPIIQNFTNITTLPEGTVHCVNFTANDSENNIDAYVIYLNSTVINRTNHGCIYFNYTSRGVWNLTFYVNDSEGLFDQEMIFLNITPVDIAPHIVDLSINTVLNEGEWINIFFNATDINENIDSIWIERNGFLVNSSNVYHWQTSFTSAGIWNLGLFVNDTSGLLNSTVIPVRVNDNLAPVIQHISSNYTNITEDSYVNFSFYANDTNGNIDSFSIYINDSLVNNTNETTYYFGITASGDWNITYLVNDTEGLFDEESFILTIDEVDQPPSIISFNYTPVVDEGDLLWMTFTSSDSNNDIDSYWITLNGSVIAVNYSYQFVTNYSSSGIYNYWMYVNDSSGSIAVQNITINIINNTKPIILSFANLSQMEQGQHYNVNFTVSDPNHNLDELFILLNGSIVEYVNSSLNQTDFLSDDLYFNFSSVGIWNLTYFVDDAEGLSSLETILINVSSSPRPPVITTIVAPNTVDEGDWLNMVFAATDPNGDIDSYWILRNGTLVYSTNIYNHIIPFDMQGDWNYTFIVNDSTGLRAVDSRVVRIIDNAPPVILSFSNYTPSFEGNTIAFNFSVDDLNGNADVSWITLNGTIINYSNAGTNYFNYTSRGVWNVTYLVNDTEGLVGRASYNLLILPTELPPNITSISYSPSLIEGKSININFSAYDLNYDIDAYQILKEGVLVNNSNQFSWHANFSDAGVWNFTLLVNDSAGNFDLERIVVNVVDNTAPRIQNFTNITTIPEGTMYCVNFTANDSENNIDSYIIYKNSSIINNTNHGCTYFDYDSEGVWSITFYVNDSEGLFDQEIILLNVTPLEWVPILDLTSLNGSAMFQNTTSVINLSRYVTIQEGSLSNLTWNGFADNLGISISVNNSDKTLLLMTNATFFGYTTINLSVTALNNMSDNGLFTVWVVNSSFFPIILGYSPNLTLLVNETDTVNFTQDSYDPSNGNLSYAWRIIDSAGVLATSNNYTHYFDYDSAPFVNLTVEITNQFGISVTLSWNITVVDVNRPPTYGISIDLMNLTDIDNSILINSEMNLTTSVLTLYNNSNLSYFESNQVDLSPYLVQNNYGVRLNWSHNNINLSLANSTNRSLSFQLGFTYSTDNNTEFLTVNESEVKQSARQYLKYRINSTLTEVVSIDRLNADLVIPDLTMMQYDTIVNWVDLDDYFLDLDSDDNLTFEIIGGSSLGATIDADNRVTFAPGSYTGTQEIMFVANDSEFTVNSTWIKIAVRRQPTRTTSYPRSGGGASGSGVAPSDFGNKTNTSESQSLNDSLKLIVANPFYLFENETFVSVVDIVNQMNGTIENISISAISNNSDVLFALTDDFIDKLDPFEKKSVKIIVSYLGAVGNFQIDLHVDSENPVFSDNGFVYFDSILRSTRGRMNLTVKMQYVDEFLTNNPECVELREQVELSRKYMREGNFLSAEVTLDNVLESCMVLIDNEGNDIDIHKKPQYSIYLIYLTAMIILSLLGVLLGIGIHIHRVIKEQRQIKKEQEEQEALDNL